MRRLFALALASVIFAAGQASAARIAVTITGLKNNEGGVYVGLYATPSKFLNGTQVDVMKKVKASTAPITVVFDNLRPEPTRSGPITTKTTTTIWTRTSSDCRPKATRCRMASAR